MVCCSLSLSQYVRSRSVSGKGIAAAHQAAEAAAQHPLLPHLLHPLHDAVGILVLLQQLVHVLHRGAGAGGDALLARRLDEVGLLALARGHGGQHGKLRSEEHTSELQSLMRISYAVFCLIKKTTY